jgi:SAM-dependent methyltransferase
MTLNNSNKKIDDIGNYFSEITSVFIEEYEQKGLKKHTKIFLDYFKEENITGLSVLELGCGVGGLLLNFLEIGAKKAYGVDLSEKMIENAKKLAKKKGFEENVEFFVGDFNSVRSDLLPVKKVDILVADRVLCCSPVPLEIVQNMLEFDPKYLVIIQPRRNMLYRWIMNVRILIRQFKLGVKKHGTKIPFVAVKEYDKLCKSKGFKKVLKKYRYSWEVVIYKN